MKKSIAVLLVIAALLTLAPAALAATPSFPDIQNAQTAKDVAVLQMLGVIEGSGGKFSPGGTLTRAEFCKMAVVISNKGAEEPQNRSRTIFPDVRSDHWGRGFVNIAASNGIIAGNSDGTFKPDDSITYAQAITILLRMLGYDDADVGLLWPSDHLRHAASIGLTKGISVESGKSIPRSDAARLFTNLLVTEKKDKSLFLKTLGESVEDAIIIDLDAKASDGTPGAVRIIGSEEVYISKSGIVPEVFLGLRGTMVLSDEKLLTFIPADGNSTAFIASSAGAVWIKDSGGKQYDFPSDFDIYKPDGSKAKLKDVFIDIPGKQVTLFYKNDRIDTVYVESRQSETAFIVTSDSVSPAAFETLTGGERTYTVFRNGYESSLSDIRKYDVATYNKSSQILSVSDFRVTAYYENVRPNSQAPSEVFFLGGEFSVLPSAAESLSAFKPGDIVTFLLTSDGQIAGAYKPQELFAAPVGIATGLTASGATVTLLDGREFSGKTKLTDFQISQLNGALVTLTSGDNGLFNLSKVGSSGGYGQDLNLNDMTFGTKKISQNVRIFDKAGNSRVIMTDRSELMQGVIPASKILYTGTDSGGRVDLIVLNDMTGDLYEYGFLKLGYEDAPALGSTVTQQRTAALKNAGDETGKDTYATTFDFKNGDAGGIALSADNDGITALVTLTSAENIRRTAFKTVGERIYVTVKGTDIPVSPGVQCYNNTTGRWFSGLEALADARAYSDNLTVYYDRPAAENGKIRLVVFG